MTRRGAEVAGLRTVAAFEAAKGILVMAAGVGVLSLIHHDVQRVAEAVVRHLHLNPARHYPQVFIAAAARVTDARLWLLASGAFAYSAVRIVEAYGLWHARVWAEWLAIVSGGLYLPVEVYELVHRSSTVKAVVLVVNLAIVGYVSYARWRGTTER
jgi:uncharacterized membrane protein (DUF2068 family)